MIEERFARGNSLLHHVSPKVKVTAAALFVAVVAISDSFIVVAAALVFALCLHLFSRLEAVPVLKRLFAANTFTLFLWLTLPITYEGTTIANLGPFSVSREGIVIAALITLKTNTIVLSLIALLSTSPVASLGHALEALHVPQRLCFLLLFSYRYVFVIHQEYLKLARATRLRCFVPSTSTHTYRTVGYLFGMTLVRSWNRASRIHQAMLLRGFNGKLLPLDQPTVDAKDMFFLATSVLISGLLVSLHWI